MRAIPLIAAAVVLSGCGSTVPASDATVTVTPDRVTWTETVTVTASPSSKAPVQGFASVGTSKPATKKPAPKPAAKPATKKPTVKATKKATPKPRAVYYKSCAAAKAAGAAPLRRGDPGYRSGLDRDGDGVACES